MKLYSGTLQSPTTISSMCRGSFSSPKVQEMVVVRGSRIIELWRFEAGQSHSHELQRIGMVNAFSNVTSVAQFRVDAEESNSSQRDLLVVTGESGFISIFRYSAATPTTENGDAIEYLDDYSTQEGVSPFFPMVYFPLTSYCQKVDTRQSITDCIGGGWERLFHTKVERSSLTGRFSAICCDGSHSAIQPNCMMFSALEKSKVCLQIGKFSKNAFSYESTSASTDPDAEDPVDEAEKGTSTFASPCYIPNIQRLNNTNIEVKQSYYLSSASEIKDDAKVCMCLVSIAQFRVFSTEPTASTTKTSKNRDNFAYFASLEINKSCAEEKDDTAAVCEEDSSVRLVVYEFNPLNHSIAVLKTIPQPSTAHAMFGIPSGDVKLIRDDGEEDDSTSVAARYSGSPGGVVVCSGDSCEWTNVLSHLTPDSKQFSEKRKLFFPRRFDMDLKTPLRVVSGVFQEKSRSDGSFYCKGFLSTSLGDVYSLILETTAVLNADALDKSLLLTQRSTISEYRISYLDTIHVPRSMTLFSNASYLFAAGDSSDHVLYEISDTEKKQFDECILALVNPTNMDTFCPPNSEIEDGSQTIPIFIPCEGTHLKPVQIIPSVSGMTKVHNCVITKEDNGLSYQCNRLVGLCGDGRTGNLVQFRKEFPSEVVSFKSLDENFPVRLFTLSRKFSKQGNTADNAEKDPHLLVFSYFDGTLVYSLDDSFAYDEKILNAPEESTDGSEPKPAAVPIPFDHPTLCTSVLTNGDYIHVQKTRLLHFVTGQFRFWKPPAESEIFLATANASQIVLALSRSTEQAEGGASQKSYFLEYFRLDEHGTLREPMKLPLNHRPLHISLSSRTSLDVTSPFLCVALEGGRVEVWELGKGTVGRMDAVYCILVINVFFPVSSLCLIANDCENTMHCVERMESGSGVFQRSQKWSLFIGYTNGFAEEKILFEQNSSDVSMRSLGNQQYQTISRGGATQPDVSNLTVKSSTIFRCGSEPVQFHLFSRELTTSVSIGGRSAKLVTMFYNFAVAVSSSTWLISLPISYCSGQNESHTRWDTFASRTRFLDEPVQDISLLGTEGNNKASSTSETTQTLWNFFFVVLIPRISSIVTLKVESRNIPGFPFSLFQCLPLLGSLRGPATSGVGFPLCAPSEEALSPNNLSVSKNACSAMPRQIVTVPESTLGILIESSHKCFTEADKEHQRITSLEKIGATVDKEKYPLGVPPTRSTEGTWVSFLRVVDLSITRNYQKEWAGRYEKDHLSKSLELSSLSSDSDGITKDILELDGNLAALSLCWVQDSHCFVVGAVRDYVPRSQEYSSGVLLVFSCMPSKFSSDDEESQPLIDLLHSTDVDGIPHAMCSLMQENKVNSEQYVIVGVGNSLQIFAIGKMHMLKKYMHPSFPTRIVSIQSVDDRLFIGDSAQSIFFARWSLESSTGIFECRVFADDCVMRWITSMEVIDYNTVAAADKFGNFFVLRVPRDVDQAFDSNEENETETMLKQIHHLNRTNFYTSGANGEFLNSCRQKGTLVAHFFVGDIITSIQRTKLDASVVLPIETFDERSYKVFEESNPVSYDGNVPHRPDALKLLCTELTEKGTEILLYSTISGAIGYFVPIISPKECQFLEKAQGFFHQCGPFRCSEKNTSSGSVVTVRPPAAFPFTASGSSVVDNNFAFSMNLSESAMLGRDIKKYRSMFAPSFGVIDGDLIHQCMRMWCAIAEKTTQSDFRVTIQKFVDGSESTQESMQRVVEVLVRIARKVFQPTISSV